MTDGILLVKKMIGESSYDVIRYLKKKFHPRSIGHAGTLDPFACGLLIIGINEGTKILPFIENKEKEYIAQLQFGEYKDTQDVTGKTIETKDYRKHSNEEIRKVFKSFIGEINQTAPKYSALKYQGKPLYEYARKNIDVPDKIRKVNIFDIKLISNDGDSIIFYCKVSPGTYIRTLGADIANKLGELGYLKNLERISVGEHYILNVKPVEAITENSIIPIKDALKIPKIECLDVKKVKNGCNIKLDYQGDLLLMMNNNIPLAIYEYNHKDLLYHCKRGFHYENI